MSEELINKPDFAAAEERLEAWWDCEVIDRVCVQLTVRREGPQPAEGGEGAGVEEGERTHATLEERWMDADYQVERALRRMERTLYAGEAFPRYCPNLGPDLWATLYGAELRFAEETSWAVHRVEDWAGFAADPENFVPSFEGKYCRALDEMTELALERGAGRFITGLPDLHPGADLISSLCGPERLCLDLMEKPELIKRINEKLTDYYPEVYDRFYTPIAERGMGTTTWLPAYHRGRFYVPSCDFSALIGPEMFNEIFLPGLRREIDFLDRSIYHLDGPDALKHLDTLLEIEGLDGIQWVYGAGNGPSTRWVDVYRRIQEAGKCCQVLVEDAGEICELLEELRPEGLLFTVESTLSRGEAEGILKRLCL